MKTYFICFSLKNSSVAEYFVALSNKLSEKHQVYILTYDTSEYPFEIKRKINIKKWPSTRPVGFKDFIFLSKLIKEKRPDCIIANFGAVNLSLICGWLFGVKNRICWYHTHSAAHSYENSFHKKRKEFVYSLATNIVAISESAKADLKNHYKVKREIVVIPNGIANPSIAQPEKLNQIIFVGRLHPVKGLDILLKALPEIFLKYPKLKLIIIGGNLKGEEIRNYRTLASELQFSDKVEFRGFKSRDYVLNELSKSKICVVPSFFEAFCYVVIESFAVGTAVIGSNTTGVAELIRHNIDGILFEPGNSADLQQAIFQLLKNENLRMQMEESAKQRFLENYEINSVIELIIKRLQLA